MAAQCCKLTDIMIAQCDHLWSVPQRLIEQARQMNTKSVYGKRQIGANAVRKLKTMSPTMNAIANGGIDKFRLNSNHVHKIIL